MPIFSFICLLESNCWSCRLDLSSRCVGFNMWLPNGIFDHILWSLDSTTIIPGYRSIRCEWLSKFYSWSCKFWGHIRHNIWHSMHGGVGVKLVHQVLMSQIVMSNVVWVLIIHWKQLLLFQKEIWLHENLTACQFLPLWRHGILIDQRGLILAPCTTFAGLSEASKFRGIFLSLNGLFWSQVVPIVVVSEWILSKNGVRGLWIVIEELGAYILVVLVVTGHIVNETISSNHFLNNFLCSKSDFLGIGNIEARSHDTCRIIIAKRVYLTNIPFWFGIIWIL